MRTAEPPILDARGAELDLDDDGPEVSLLDVLTWLGEGKKWIVGVTAAVAIGSTIVAMLLPDEYTARASLLPPNSQQQSSSAALAALGALGGLAGGAAGAGMGGLIPKSPDELYVALLKSDSVQRELADRFQLKQRWDVKTYEQLRKTFADFVRVTPDKKSGVITVLVDDEDPRFAADLANAYAGEITKVLARLAVSEAQQRRVFFDQQLKDTKEHLIQAEHDLRKVQEKSGVIVLDKQAEALITGAAMVRAQIAEREVQLKVMRTIATDVNPDVLRVAAELRALRSELARMESTQGNPGSAVDMPVGRIPEAAIDYVRARRELKLQETLLESMIRQYEIAKLDEAKEGPVLQVVDYALPPDRKSKPARAVIVLASTLATLLLASTIVAMRRYAQLARERDPGGALAWESARRAWRLRR
jgi:tyrosine-protein kinase Etk/Wzc